jgi:hypothetical protein
MVRGPAWRFLDMGRRLERALSICRMMRQMGSVGEEADRLSLLLDIFDSQITYRSRYLSAPMRDPVLDLLLLDPDNPRSLAWQVMRWNATSPPCPALARMPARGPLREARDPGAAFQPHGRRAGRCAAARHRTRLLALSDTISARYFLQFDAAAPVRTPLSV